MNKNFQEIFEHLRSDRPSFLIVGQGYLALEDGLDPLLYSVISKYGAPDASKANLTYRNLLECNFEDEDAARAWISDVSRRLVSPPWLEVVAKMPWSGVYTSSIDTLLLRAFRSDWRDVQPIFSKKFIAPDPRSRSNLHVTYLFGCVERENDDERSPLNEIDLIRRSSDATILLSRLSELITPLGMLFIDGFRSKQDWLGVKELATVILDLDVKQVHFFSVPDDLREDPIIKHLLKQGKLSLHEQSLASLLNEGYSAGVLSFDVKRELQKQGHYVSLGEHPIEIPDSIWTLTSRSATIIDDAVLSTPALQTEDGKYRAFRNFLADSGVRPVWSAYVSGFALERDFEQDLTKLVHSRLRARSSANDPVILHGQTGTGKSVALGALAHRIRREKQYAVLYIERRPQGPVAADLDTFCKWADDAGFAATLIVWDGMVHIEMYAAVLKNLLGRGRNVVLVGSAYKLDQGEADARSLVLAPPTFSATEISKFKALVSRFEQSLGPQFDELLRKNDTTFLVAVYRLLPETRGQVKYGLQRETSAAEVILRKTAAAIEPEFAGGALAAALQRSKALERFEILPEESRKVGGETMSTTEELVGLIMVPGRFGLKVPIELVIRVLGRSKIANFHKIFESVDIFRWSSDQQGSIFIGARHPLEAKLICQVRLGGPRMEVEFAKKLLSEVEDSLERSESTQVQFATDLLRNLGPNGPERKLYSEYYEELATTLETLRKVRGVVNPRIMLQEASLLREAVVAVSDKAEGAEERINLLTRAVATLEAALQSVNKDYRTRRLRAMLLVELASTLGTKVRELLQNGHNVTGAMNNFFEARKYAYQARALQPEDFFAIDVLSWSTKDLISGGQVDEASRLDIIVDLLSMFEACDEQSMTLRDKELFYKRKVEIGNLLKDETLKEDALARLKEMGSKAGYYLNALLLAQEHGNGEHLSADDLKRLTAAVEYLQSNYSEIESDGRCLFLLLRYWWMVKVKKPFFGGERQLVPFSLADWRYLISMLDHLMSLDEVYRTPMNTFLRAVATWSVGYYDDALEIWKHLQRESDSVTGRRRVAKSYVASNSDGSLAIFNGTIDWVSDDETRGKIFVEGIRQKVDFFPRDFGISEPRRNQAVNNFSIAFNYIGPVADRHNI